MNNDPYFVNNDNFYLKHSNFMNIGNFICIIKRQRERKQEL